jgi:hypothetical protein
VAYICHVWSWKQCRVVAVELLIREIARRGVGALPITLAPTQPWIHSLPRQTPPTTKNHIASSYTSRHETASFSGISRPGSVFIISEEEVIQ